MFNCLNEWFFKINLSDIFSNIGSLILCIKLGLCSSKKTDKELFDEAKASLKDQKYPEAVMSFEELVKDYPDSKLAPEALSETASIYQNKQIKNLSEKENLNKAIELFKKIHDDYPKSEFAPSGLFMAGFICVLKLLCVFFVFYF